MKVSLENFNDFIGTKTIIIGDMLELGRRKHNRTYSNFRIGKITPVLMKSLQLVPHFKEVNILGGIFNYTRFNQFLTEK